MRGAGCGVGVRGTRCRMTDAGYRTRVWCAGCGMYACVLVLPLVSVTKDESVSVTGWVYVIPLIASHFSFTLSLARLSGHVWSCCALCLDLLVLLSSSSNSSPSAPGIEKISPNHQHQHPDPPAHHPTNRPTTHDPPTYQPIANHKARPHSDPTPFAQSPVQNHTTRVRVRVRSASPNLARLEARDTRVRLRGRLLSSSSLGSRVLGLFCSMNCIRVLVLVLMLVLPLVERKISVSVPRSTPGPGLVPGGSNSS